MLTSRESLVLSIDGVEDRPFKQCSKCGHPKPTDEFRPQPSRKDGLHSWCRMCTRLARNASSHTEEGKAKAKEYNAREGVRVRKQEWFQARRAADPEAVAEKYRKYWATPMGRLIHNRASARYRLDKASRPESRARIEATIAAYDHEIARLKRDHELRAEPPPIKPDREPDGYKGCFLNPSGTVEARVCLPGGGQSRCGTFATVEEARAAVNERAKALLGISDYATPRWRRQA